MKKILIVLIVAIIGSQLVYADIAPGNANLDISMGINGPLSYSESGFPGGIKINQSQGVGVSSNFTLLFGTSEDNELGFGLGVECFGENPTSQYQNLEENFFLNSSNNFLITIPIYVEDKYIFEGNSIQPFLLGRIGIDGCPSNNSFAVIDGLSTVSLTQEFNPGLYLGAGAGVYLTNNTYVEADVDYYQMSCQFDGSEQLANVVYKNEVLGTDNISILTTGVQIGYSF